MVDFGVMKYLNFQKDIHIPYKKYIEAFDDLETKTVVNELVWVR